MKIIEIVALKNGAHRNQSSSISVIPNGYAVIPDEMETPNFPFGSIEVEEINGVMTVTKWTAGEIPETPVEKPEPTVNDIINAMLGVNE